MRLRAAVVVAASALLAGCAASVLAGHGAPAADFTDCSDRINIPALNLPAGRADKLSFECATISVPLDYGNPTGRSISLQLLRIHDSDNHSSTGSLIVNPGGPGGSGVNLALGIAGQVSNALLSHFDLVGFDPRGVGLSTPLKCLSNADKDRINAASPDVLTSVGFAEAKRLAGEIAQKCSTRYGAELADYNTLQTARDMDQIRQAVGDSQMNYLGFSYGTKLGAQYAHLFPSKIRVAVLDGAVDPLTDDITSFADQVRGFEGAFDQFEHWCSRHSPCSGIGDPRTVVSEIADEARRSPIPSSAAGEKRKATPAIVYTGVLSALYSQAQWEMLGQALRDARAGDAKLIFKLADNYNERYGDGQYTNIADANTTINCNDSKLGPTDATIRATARSWAQRFPLFGRWAAAGLFSCQQWQRDRTVPPLPTATSTPDKILVIGNLNDPATPYQGAQDLSKTLGNAELLTWNGEGHTSYLQGSSCIDKYVENYLINKSLPPAHKICQ